MHEIGEEVGVMPRSLCIRSVGLPTSGIYLRLSFRALPLSYWDCFASRNWEEKVYISPGVWKLSSLALGWDVWETSWPSRAPLQDQAEATFHGALTWLPLLSCPVLLPPSLVCPENTSLISYLLLDPCRGSAFREPHWRHYLKNKNSLDSHRWEGICDYH